MHKLFRLTGFAEAFSFIYLLGVAMPQKYLENNPIATKTPGMIHGILFIAYVVLAYNLSNQEKWTQKKLWMAYIASVLPFGTLVFDFTQMRASSSESIKK